MLVNVIVIYNAFNTTFQEKFFESAVIPMNTIAPDKGPFVRAVRRRIRATRTYRELHNNASYNNVRVTAYREDTLETIRFSSLDIR